MQYWTWHSGAMRLQRTNDGAGITVVSLIRGRLFFLLRLLHAPNFETVSADVLAYYAITTLAGRRPGPYVIASPPATRQNHRQRNRRGGNDKCRRAETSSSTSKFTPVRLSRPKKRREGIEDKNTLCYQVYETQRHRRGRASRMQSKKTKEKNIAGGASALGGLHLTSIEKHSARVPP